jgi:hypothetical protein
MAAGCAEYEEAMVGSRRAYRYVRCGSGSGESGSERDEGIYLWASARGGSRAGRQWAQ